MDKDEFQSRAFANPFDDDQAFLDAARSSPQHQLLIEELQHFDRRIQAAAQSVHIPEDLASRLKSHIHSESAAVRPHARRSPDFRWLAIAACLLLAVGLSAPLLLGTSEPSAADLAMGQQVLRHVYAETADFVADHDVNFVQINQVMASVGGHIADNDSTRDLHFSFAKPCLILSPDNTSAHFVMQGEHGSVNVILMNNAPVDQGFAVKDDRFSGSVSPLSSGNLVLIGEKDEGLEDFAKLLADNIDWVI